MRRSFLAVALISSGLLAMPQHAGSADSKPNTIIVRMLNAKSGKPVKNQITNVWFDDARDPLYPVTDSNGEVQLTVVSDAKTISFYPGDSWACWYKRDGKPIRHTRFSLEDIISKGIVSQNFCGKARIESAPGVLVVYVRGLTFLERWNL